MGVRTSWGNGEPLILRPHAFFIDTSEYDRFDHSINFGYVRQRFPYRYEYDCLNHDIISHEVGHAVFSDLRPLYDYNSDLDVPALHEAFADLVAILSALGHADVVDVYVGQVGGTVSVASIVSCLGETSRRVTYHTRSLFDGPDYGAGIPQQRHERSLVWTSALFAVFEELHCTAQEIPGAPQEANEAIVKAAEWLQKLLVRSLNYLPPTGVTMRTWAAAMLAADKRMYEDDNNAVRAKMRKVFEARGLSPSKKLDLKEDWPSIAPPRNAVALQEALMGDRVTAAIVHAFAADLFIPLGEGVAILEPVLTSRYSNYKDSDEEDPKATEHYLQYVYRVDDGENMTYMGGTLVLNWEWLPVGLLTDPALSERERAYFAGEKLSSNALLRKRRFLDSAPCVCSTERNGGARPSADRGANTRDSETTSGGARRPRRVRPVKRVNRHRR